jgi:hypothetical protein
MEHIGSTPLFGNFITMLNLLAKFAIDVDADNDESYVFVFLFYYFIIIFPPLLAFFLLTSVVV